MWASLPGSVPPWRTLGDFTAFFPCQRNWATLGASMTELFTIGYSPWSEKARWALDHHRIAYREPGGYVPGFTVPWLRARYGMRETITMPFLVTGEERIHDSQRIARWAEAHGQGSPLFPPSDLDEIDRWNEDSEEVLDSGRAIFLWRLVEDPAARALMLPKWASGFPPLHAFARARSRALLQKYGGVQRTKEAHTERMRAAFQRMSTALADGRRHLLGRFTFADIAAANAVHYLTPVVHPRVPIAQGTHGVWAIDELAAEFPDLIGYRDALYATDRTSE